MKITRNQAFNLIIDLFSWPCWRGMQHSFFMIIFQTRMGDCLQTGKPSQYITNTNVYSAFHPSRGT